MKIITNYQNTFLDAFQEQLLKINESDYFFFLEESIRNYNFQVCAVKNLFS